LFILHTTQNHDNQISTNFKYSNSHCFKKALEPILDHNVLTRLHVKGSSKACLLFACIVSKKGCFHRSFTIFKNNCQFIFQTTLSFIKWYIQRVARRNWRQFLLKVDL
jgi:hypothetical protein